MAGYFDSLTPDPWDPFRPTEPDWGLLRPRPVSSPNNPLSDPAPMPSFPVRPPRGVLPLIPPPPGTALVLPPRTGFSPLSDDDYSAAAKEIGCEVRMVKTVAAVESGGYGFDSAGYPFLLFEPKLFFELIGSHPIYRTKYHDLTVKTGHYGSYNLQWQRLQKAYWLNPRAAIQACSWGKFQLIARFYIENGYPSAEKFLTEMFFSEQLHVKAFISKIRRKNLQTAMADKDFDKIGRFYNGEKNTHVYADKLRVAYAQIGF